MLRPPRIAPLALLLLAPLLSSQDGEVVAPPRLGVGKTVEGVLVDGELVSTPTLDASYRSAPTVGRAFTFVATEPGAYTIELRSWHFDAYLVLRDAQGNLLAEDDDGLLFTHAQLATPELERGETYLVLACALHGARGRFELVLRRGAPRPLSPTQRALAEIVDLQRRAVVIDEVDGPDSEALAGALNELGVALYHQERYSDAEGVWRRALAIREKALGPEHPTTAESLNNLGFLLSSQGKLAAARPLYERALAIWEKVLGPEHPDTATSLNNLGALLEAQGELAAARPLFERALAIVEKALGPEHPTTASSLNNLGGVLISQGELAAARPVYERALAIREKVLGPEHPTTAASLNNLGLLLEAQGELAAARPLFERALAIWEKVLGPEHPDTATGLNNLGYLLSSQGELAAARPYVERALAVWEKVLGPEHPDTALSLGNLGGLLEAQGELAAARPLYERALAIQEKVLGPEHPDTALSLDHLGGLLEAQGELAAARPLHERALAIQEKVLGPEHPDTALSLNNLGFLLEAQGELAAARPLYERALAIWEKVLGPEHPTTATCLNNLGGLLEAQGELAAARRLYERALAIREKVLGPEHPTTATSLDNLGGLLRSQGELAAAWPLYERALAIREKVLGTEHPTAAASLNNLGALLYSQGELAAARPYVVRALAIVEKVLGPEHPTTASSLNNLGFLLRSQGELAAAQPLYERALAIWEKVLGPEHPDTATGLNNLALLLTEAGERDRARDLILGSAPGLRAHLQRMLGGLTESESFQYLAKLRWQLVIRLNLFVSEDPEILAEAYGGVLDWKGQIARTLIASREQLGRDLTGDQRELVVRLRAEQAQLSRTLSEDASPEQVERLAALRRERNRLELELRRTLEGVEGVDDVSLADVRAALPLGTAVLDLFVHRLYTPASWNGEQLVRRGSWTEDHTIAWIVRPEGRGGEENEDDRDRGLVRVDLGPAAELEEAARAFLEELVARRGAAPSEGQGSDAAVELRRLLWEPLADHLQGVETLFVSPDTFLGTLPFETIELEDGSFLVEELGIVYLQDVSSLARRDEEPTRDYDSLLAMGAVDFRKRAEWELDASAGHVDAVEATSPMRGSFTDYWGPLPATAYESDVVHAMHEDAFGEEGERLLLQGAEPSEERLKHELQRHSVLHLATHGFFQPEGTPSMWESALNEAGKREMRMSEEAAHLVGKHPGLLSGLVCAGANRQSEGGDDGYLTAEEVGWLDLSKAELVVMSACETGLGRAKSGEGLIGLRRAFQIAGAKTVISSLWSVKDESTAELMRDFYKNLFLKRMGRHEALRAAQLAMLQRNRMEHGEALPSTWGAFVLSGEWR